MNTKNGIVSDKSKKSKGAYIQWKEVSNASRLLILKSQR